jgi:hypothetical protein
MYLVHNPGIAVLAVLILALAGMLAWHLTHKKTGPGPDTVIRRALSASEIERDAMRIRASGSTSVAKGPGQVKVPGVVVKTQTHIPVPPPRPAPYARLRENADRMIAAETTELAAISPELIAADRAALLVAQHATPVSTAPEVAPPTSPLDMSVAQLMEQIEREARQSVALLASRPQTTEMPLSPARPDRRVHAELADGSQLVRYERAGKWFHEGPGLRRRITLHEAAELAMTPRTVVHSGLPGGQMFELRIRRNRELS